MAPGLNIDMEAFQEVDQLQSYWKLFPYIAKDFLTIADFKIMMAQATAPPPGYKVVFVPTGAGASALAVAYNTASKTGAAARGAVVAGLETVTG